jgi:hypothetical protein
VASTPISDLPICPEGGEGEREGKVKDEKGGGDGEG